MRTPPTVEERFPTGRDRRGRLLWDAVGAVSVVIFAGAFAGLLWVHTGLRHDDAELLDPSTEIRTGEEWMGLYHKGVKIGLMHTVKTARPEGGFRFEVLTHMRLKAFGRDAEFDLRLHADLASSLALEHFEFALETGPAHLRGEGRVDGKTVELSINTGGERSTHRYDLPEAPVLRANLGPLLSRRALAPGTRYTFSTFDPMTQSQQQVEVEVIGPDTVVAMGQEVPAIHIRQRISGLELDGWVNQRGEWLRQTLTMGIVAIRETEEEARWAQAGEGTPGLDAADLAADSMIAVAGLPPRLDDAHELIVAVTGVELDAARMTDGRRQTLKTTDNGTTLRVVREAVGRGVPFPIATDNPEIAAALAAEPLVQSGHPRILAAAREAIGDAIDTVTAAKRLSAWVRERLEPENVFGVPSALETLAVRVGDCNEHSTLYAALARSLGVPARIVVGLAYQRGRFGYHAWNEVWTADGWLTVDSTWGQVPADPGHVKFVTGGLSRQLELMQVIGQLDFELLHFVR